METTQKPGTVESNPIHLKQTVAKTVVKELDFHLCSLMALFHQYYKHHWLVKGPQFHQLHVFFERKYKEVQDDFDSVAERITLLGGVPTSSPAIMAEKSFLKAEEEGDHPIREMMSKGLSDEGILAEKLRDCIEMVMKNRDYGTERLLKKVLSHCEERAHEIEHFLADDSLENKAAPAGRSRH